MVMQTDLDKMVVLNIRPARLDEASETAEYMAASPNQIDIIE